MVRCVFVCIIFARLSQLFPLLMMMMTTAATTTTTTTCSSLYFCSFWQKASFSALCAYFAYNCKAMRLHMNNAPQLLLWCRRFSLFCMNMYTCRPLYFNLYAVSIWQLFGAMQSRRHSHLQRNNISFSHLSRSLSILFHTHFYSLLRT